METINMPLKTMTPLWTGDIDKNSPIPKETGILGSLRWWYEGIVRGMGGYACDPVGTEQGGAKKSESHCGYNPGDNSEINLCPACRLFGTTGWRRQFRLELTGLEAIPLFFSSSPSTYQTSGNWLWRIFGGNEFGGKKLGHGKNTKFIFDKKMLWGLNAKLKIIRLSPDFSREDLNSRLSFLLDFIQKWGGLGAKTQYGFGQIKCDLNPDEIARGKRLIARDSGADNYPSHNGNHFSISRFFSIIFKIEKIEGYVSSAQLIGEPGNMNFKSHFLPCAFDICYKSKTKNPFTKSGKDFGMRPHFKRKFNDKITNELFGNSKANTEDQRSGGNIGVSHLYHLPGSESYYLKVWGHIPESINITVDSVVEEVKNFVFEMFPESIIDEKFSDERNQ